MNAYFVPVLFAMLEIVTYAGFGFLLRVKTRLGSEFFNNLNEFLVRMALPLYYFSRVSRTNVEAVLSSWFFPLAAIVITAVTAVVSLLYLRAFKYEGSLKRTVLALSVFGNAGFMPLFLAELFPLTIPAFGEAFGTSVPLLYIGTYMLIASPALWGGANYIVAGKAEGKGFAKLRGFLSPPIFGILAGLLVAVSGRQHLLFDKTLPLYYIYEAVDKIGSVVPPLLIVCLGAIIANLKSIKLGNRGALIRTAFHVSVVRFLILPALFFLAFFTILRPLGLSPTHSWVIFLQMVIPPATSLAILAARYTMHEDHVGFTLLVSYILYIVILPVYLMIFISLPGIMK